MQDERKHEWLLRCAGCGDVVGGYEPVWIEHDDGRLSPSSLLNFDRDARAAAPRLFHAGCVLSDE